MLVTTVDDTEEDPGYFFLSLPFDGRPPSVGRGDPAGIKMNLHEADMVAVSFTQRKYRAFEDGQPARCDSTVECSAGAYGHDWAELGRCWRDVG